MSNHAEIPAGGRAGSALRFGASAVAVALCLASGGAAAAPTFTVFDPSPAVGSMSEPRSDQSTLLLRGNRGTIIMGDLDNGPARLPPASILARLTDG